VLAPGNGKTKTARLWTYVRDDPPVAIPRRRRCGSPVSVALVAKVTVEAARNAK
jgi:hypothetical protein